jgi:2-haloacid dehalogenase
MESAPGPVVFDAYGTLFDPISLAGPLERRFPGRGVDLARTWRATQLRHTWLRSLMGAWADFDAVTRDALAQTLSGAGLAPDDALAAGLLATYRTLPAYPDVSDALAALEPDRPRAILTNGRRETVEATVRAAGLAALLPTVLSVEAVRIYKPAPVVYALAPAHFGRRPAEITFVSGNAWDCAGAAASGMRVVRVARTAEAEERIGPPPVAVIDDLRDLARILRRTGAGALDARVPLGQASSDGS